MENDLFILWTNDNLLTTENMICMYSVNSLKRKWWDAVTVIVWGASVKLLAENESVQKRIQQIRTEGVSVSICKASSEKLGVVNKMENLGFEVKYWGEYFTQIMQSDKELLTI